MSASEEPLNAPEECGETSSEEEEDSESDTGLNGVYWSEVSQHVKLRPIEVGKYTLRAAIQAPQRFTEQYADDIAEVYRKDAERRERKRRRKLSFGMDLPAKPAPKSKPMPAAAVRRWNAFF